MAWEIILSFASVGVVAAGVVLLELWERHVSPCLLRSEEVEAEAEDLMERYGALAARIAYAQEDCARLRHNLRQLGRWRRIRHRIERSAWR
jgi:hypothetical protein